MPTIFKHPAVARFVRWYAVSGHWVYETRLEAVQVWLERGITSMSPAPEGAQGMLAEWVAADTAPALIARLRAEEQQAARK